MEIRQQPLIYIPILELALKELYLNLTPEENSDIPTFQLSLRSGEDPVLLRNLNYLDIGKIIQVQGIIIKS